VRATTIVVIAISFLIGIYLYAVDLFLSWVVSSIFDWAGR
jgi:preprotein translocase subunit SecE